ncbi:MAG: hypothetical protein A2Y17_02995 [Clostridiales bacterium GWF2_38_85]|nr:MAG: hypothetical protein A2Y17_02995 [Clostridiales bacterium GWF2_38_85]
MGKIFNIFTGHRDKDGKGITKEEAGNLEKLSFINFFKMFSIKFNNIVKSNALFFLCNIPIIFALYALAGFQNIITRAPTDLLYPNIYGVIKYEGINTVTAALNSHFGIFAELSVPSKATMVLYAISLICIFTFGLANVGMTYLLRDSVRNKSIFIWHDFLGAIKKNWKQGLIIGIFDITIIYILYYDLISFYYNSSSFINAMGFYAIVFIALLYIIIRNYLYLLSITFSLKISKIINYSFRLALLGIKRNILALMGIAIVIYINIVLYFLIQPLGVFLPFIFTIGICGFMGVYASWPVVEKYLVKSTKNDNEKIKPLYEYESDDESEESKS